MEGIKMTKELIRANRVAVKANEEGYVADFYRTHKLVGSVYSGNTEWVAPEDANKSMVRESFRMWAIENCEDHGILWDPSDKRAPGNVRKAKYDSDEALVEDAMALVIPEMRALVEKCKYEIEWGGIEHDDIVPMTHTGSGKELNTMGIEYGKYLKSGNWAWAWLKFITNFKFKGEECYIPVTMQLVSGQLKKVGMGITEFNSRVKAEIVGAGLATEEELDPPKESKKKSKKSDETAEEKAERIEKVVIVEDTEEIQADEVVVAEVETEVTTPQEIKKAKGRARKSKRVQEVE